MVSNKERKIALKHLRSSARIRADAKTVYSGRLALIGGNAMLESLRGGIWKK